MGVVRVYGEIRIKTRKSFCILVGVGVERKVKRERVVLSASGLVSESYCYMIIQSYYYYVNKRE